MTQRFLVTGGAGYVGSHVVAALTDRGDAVVVIDNHIEPPSTLWAARGREWPSSVCTSRQRARFSVHVEAP